MSFLKFLDYVENTFWIGTVFQAAFDIHIFSIDSQNSRTASVVVADGTEFWSVFCALK